MGPSINRAPTKTSTSKTSYWTGNRRNSYVKPSIKSRSEINVAATRFSSKELAISKTRQDKKVRESKSPRFCTYTIGRNRLEACRAWRGLSAVTRLEPNPASSERRSYSTKRAEDDAKTHPTQSRGRSSSGDLNFGLCENHESGVT